MEKQHIESLAIPVPPLDAGRTCGEVFDIFDADADTLVLAVVEGNRPVGMVNRYSFLLRFGDRFGRALFEKQPITELMDRYPLIVDGGRSIDFVSNLIVTEHEAALLRGFIITRGGRYLGMGTGLSLMRVTLKGMQRNALMLREVVTALPISLTVQDSDGRLLIVNDRAAEFFRETATSMKGRLVYDFMSEGAAARRRHRQAELIRSGQSLTVEETLEERILLTSYKPVTVFDDTLFISTSLDITERKRSEQELARRADFDDLTGLPNRACIARHVEEVLTGADTPAIAIAFIDLDNFKHINDYYSHAIGDALLVAVAERVSRHTRKTDRLARISGDEFLLVLNPITSQDALHTAIERVRDCLRQPFIVESFEIFTSASIGVSLYPEQGIDYETLRRRADSAMYRSKSIAKGSVTYYDAQVGEVMTARMELEQRLRLAIRDQLFCCVFQPKVDIRQGSVTGFEALARWSDGAGAMRGPGHFIGLAGELGLLDEITWNVLDDATRGLAILDQRFGTDTTLSINIAAHQASDPAFMAQLIEHIDRCGQGHRLMLELTEDGFLGASKFQTQMLPRLRELGVKVSIDDFGTGYSSLATLADITADEIKVDRSFISAIQQRARNQSVLKAIESLSHALNMTVVAEGVETEAELAYLLSSTTIDLAQGFFFARPMRAEALVAEPSLDRAPKPAEPQYCAAI